MGRFNIKDLPKQMKISADELKRVSGGSGRMVANPAGYLQLGPSDKIIDIDFANKIIEVDYITPPADQDNIKLT